MTIQELADRAAVTTRTIRYYVEQGVLPPPGRGRPSEYTDEHVRLLDLIRRLKAQYLPLEEIRDILQRLTPDQVEEFLGPATTPEPVPETSDSAADYIAQVLNRGALRSQLKEQTSPPPVAQPMPAPAQPPGQPTPRPYQPASDPPPGPPVAAVPLQTKRAIGTGVTPPPTNDGSASKSSGSDQQHSSPAEERTWQRVTLAPGVELHYEPRAPGASRGSIDRLIEAARTILGLDPEKGTAEPK